MIYALGPFRLDTEALVLTHDGAATALGRRGVAVLAKLVSRAGEYVEKSVIMDAAWPDVVVEEDNLTAQISAIRRVLERVPGGKDWIETLTRRGYRFVGPVSTEAARATHNLPRPLTSFIGREREIAEIKSLFGTTRLLTLAGPGGTGKTRLALEVAADLLANHQDGVWVTELAAIAEPDRVTQTVATSLGVAEQRGKSLMQALIDHLTSRCLVLLLDNAEHLLRPCAEFVYAVLRHCGNVQVLVTSREPLGVGGELLYRVPPMAVPDPKQDVTPDDIADYESVRLFIERARLHQPGFVTSIENAASVASICHRLDGIPLSLELAAARVRSMPVEEIDRRLDQRFGLLKTGDPTALPRHRTLRALVDWSYELLSERSRVVLRRVSVFAGGWTIDAAEAVVAGSHLTVSEVLDALIELTEKSLVQLDTATSRYAPLETIKQYGYQRLVEAGEEADVRTRHLMHFVAVAEHLARDEAPAVGRFRADLENLLAADAWCDQVADGATLGLRLVNAIGGSWTELGLMELGYRTMTRALARPGVDDHRLQQCKALSTLGYHCYFMARHGEARGYLEKSLAMARASDAPRQAAVALYRLAIVSMAQNELPGARACAEESLALAREHDAAATASLSLETIGLICRAEGNFAEARRCFEQVLVDARAQSQLRGVASIITNLASVTLRQGDLPLARRQVLDALESADAAGSLRLSYLAVDTCAALAAESGRFELAARLRGAIDGRRAHDGSPRESDDEAVLAPALNRARIALGDTFAIAHAAGTTLGFDGAVAEARAWLAQSDMPPSSLD